jgi:hypothetical protein
MSEIANLDLGTNPFEEYAKQYSSRNIVGRLLKFSKGDYVVDNHELPLGTRLVALVDQTLVGWQKWEDNKPVDQKIGLLSEGFKPPQRDELGDDDQDMWETNSNGKPRDPWQFTNMLVMQDVEDKSTMYTFATTSRGGLDAIADLCRVYGRNVRSQPGRYPIVALKSDSYTHGNKEFGKIKVPIFEVVGWTE